MYKPHHADKQNENIKFPFPITNIKKSINPNPNSIFIIGDSPINAPRAAGKINAGAFFITSESMIDIPIIKAIKRKGLKMGVKSEVLLLKLKSESL